MGSSEGSWSGTTSVGTSLQLITAGIVAVALMLTLGIGYVTTVAAMEQESLRALQHLMESRSSADSSQFFQAEDNVHRLKERLLESLSEIDDDFAEAEFHRLFQPSEDGLWRVRPAFDDFARLPSLYLQQDAPLTLSLYKRAVVSYQLLAERGPAIVPPYYSVYMDFVERGLMVYSPYVNWGAGATRETDNYNYPTMIGSMPANNPERKKFWTPVYFDEEAAVWMVSVIEPLDVAGEWVGTVGHDVKIDSLMKSNLAEIIEGTYNIILSREGQLIVHPDFTDRIQEAKGDLSLSTLNDPVLSRVSEIAQGLTDFPTIGEDPLDPQWYGIAKIDGPDWFLVTVYPERLVFRRAFQALILPISIGLIILVIALVLMNLAVRRSILRPLQFMDDAVYNMTQGVRAGTIPIETDDEFGRLARSFESMSERLERREQSLEASHRDWERTFDTVPEMIAMLDCDTRIKQANKTFLERHETDAEGCIDRKRMSLLHDGDGPGLKECLALLLATQRPQHLELRFETISGHFDITLAPMFDDSGALVGIVEVSRDITEQIHLEEQLRHAQKMDAVGQLAGGIAHDFNNLLQVILGYTEGLLIDLKPEETGFEELTETQKAAERAAALTRQLLAFSRRQVIVTKSQDLNEIVSGTVNMVRRLIGEHIDLYYIPAPEAAIADVDQNQIEQVILNLCINSRDAMPDGGVLTIELKTIFLDATLDPVRGDLKSGEYVQLIVTDSGTGIPPEIQDHIFEPFFTTKETNKGTGLGLATVYGIVRQHDGSIELYSEPDRGTTFRVFLPVSPGAVGTGLKDVEVAVSGGDECILVAEDDEQIQLLVKKVLKSAGYTVLVARDGEEALKIYESHGSKIDLLLLDVIMPKINGKVVLERIQEVRPDVPCLFASGYSQNALHNNFKLQAGLNLIEKPYRRTDLLQKVRRVLEQRNGETS